jgi:diguanylate cyclase (GGDEF)-like protein
MPLMSDTKVFATASLSSGSAAHSTAGLFWIILARIVAVIAVNDLLLLLFFLAAHAPVQAWINIGSILIYGSAYCLLKRRWNRLALTLIWMEVLVHTITGTVLAGWASGFHYYLLMFVPAIIIGAPRRRALCLLAVLWSVYLGLLFDTNKIAPLEPLGPQALLLLHVFNASVLFIMVTYFTFMYRTLASASERKLKLLATTDPLTGLFNRRHANEIAMREANQDGRTGRPLSFILADIDNFKAINDQYGHEGGDTVLVEVSRALSSVTRAHDILARWGGEEFLLVLPDTSREGAAELASRIYHMMQTLRPMIGAHQAQITLTMGISSQRFNEGFGAALARADQALYEGKRAGRNCVRLDRDAPPDIIQDNMAQAYHGCSHAA